MPAFAGMTEGDARFPSPRERRGDVSVRVYDGAASGSGPSHRANHRLLPTVCAVAHLDASLRWHDRGGGGGMRGSRLHGNDGGDVNVRVYDGAALGSGPSHRAHHRLLPTVCAVALRHPHPNLLPSREKGPEPARERRRGTAPAPIPRHPHPSLLPSREKGPEPARERRWGTTPSPIPSPSS